MPTAFRRPTGPQLLLMLALLGADQALKVWVRSGLPLGHARPLVPHLIDLTHVRNPGVSFSLLGNLPDGMRVPLLVGVSLVAVGLLTAYWLRNRAGLHPASDWAFPLILPGALGNLTDRVLFGAVTDYLHFRFYSTSFFVNNLADILISLGVAAYVLGLVLGPAASAGEERAND